MISFRVVCVGFLLSYTLFAAGCATMIKGTQSNVYLLNAPEDIRVFNGSEPIRVTLMEAHELYSFGDSFKDEMNHTKTTHYAPGFTLNCNQTYHLTLKSGHIEGMVTLEPRMAMRWFWLDLFGLVAAIAVDWRTGAWNELGPDDGDINAIDVSRYIK